MAHDRVAWASKYVTPTSLVEETEQWSQNRHLRVRPYDLEHHRRKLFSVACQAYISLMCSKIKLPRNHAPSSKLQRLHALNVILHKRLITSRHHGRPFFHESSSQSRTPLFFWCRQRYHSSRLTLIHALQDHSYHTRLLSTKAKSSVV